MRRSGTRAMTPLLKGLLESGAPWGLLCAALVFAVSVLWRRYVEVSDRLYALSAKYVESTVEFRAALEGSREEIRELRRSFT